MPEVDLEELRSRLAVLGRAHTPVDVAQALREIGAVVTDASVAAALRQLRLESVGAGPLEPLLALPGVSDVLVNGPDEVYFDRGEGLERSDIRFGNEESLRRLATRLAASAGRRLDDASPFVDGQLASGVRLHAVLAPVAAPGTCLSLRVPARRSFSLAEIVAQGSVPPAGADLLAQLVRARLPFLVTGGTGTGKTTLLAALLALVPEHERIVLVEDSRELNPDHPHCVRLEGRSANAEGAGEIALTSLVRQALRMRPDRLVLGEVRGAELRDLLTALNTGHEGGCATVHANSPEDVPARLEALAALGGLGREACHAQVAAGLRVVVHLRRDGRGRRVDGLGVLVRDGELVRVLPAVGFTTAGLVRASGAELLDEWLAS